MLQRKGKNLTSFQCLLIDIVLLGLGTEGIVTGFFTAFSFPCHEWMLYLVTGILTLAAALFFSVNIQKNINNIHTAQVWVL